jgi:uncharacterized Zn finger protein (UPF0148 family)
MIHCKDCNDPVFPDEDGQMFRGNKEYCPLCLQDHNRKASLSYQRRKREINKLKRNSIQNPNCG